MNNKIFKLLLSTFLVVVSIIILLPLGFLIIKGIFSIKECLLSEEIIFSIKLSLKTSIISTFICMILAIPAAYALSSLNFKWKKPLSLLLFLPISLPHLVAGIALLLVFGNSFIGRALQGIGLDFVFTVKGIILAQVFVNISFAMKILKTAIDGLDRKLEFVGRTLGCSKFQSFTKVTLPLMKRDILATTVITFSRSLGEFGAIMILVGTTRMKTELLPTAIFLNVSTGDMNIAIGTATILIIISILSMVIFELLEKNKNV